MILEDLIKEVVRHNEEFPGHDIACGCLNRQIYDVRKVLTDLNDIRLLERLAHTLRIIVNRW